MIISYHNVNVEAIKPRQIISYDMSIVLIDLHQLNVKTTSDNTTQHEPGQPHVNGEQNRRTTTRNIRFLTK